MLLWTEYKTQYPEKSYQYSQFCELYKLWSKKLSVVMRQEHKVGEKIFVDYAGTTLSVLDTVTGEQRQAQVFVGALGASSYVFAEATWTQGLPDWLMSHRRMFEFFGGVSEILVPDNLKSGITKPDRYEAKINESYREFAEHYSTCVIPARVRKPKDNYRRQVSSEIYYRDNSTTQLLNSQWHEYLGGGMVADAICDRLLRPALKLDLKGDTKRPLGDTLT